MATHLSTDPPGKILQHRPNDPLASTRVDGTDISSQMQLIILIGLAVQGQSQPDLFPGLVIDQVVSKYCPVSFLKNLDVLYLSSESNYGNKYQREQQHQAGE